MEVMAVINLGVCGAARYVWEKAGETVGLVCGPDVHAKPRKKGNGPYVGKAPELRVFAGREHFRYNTGIGLGSGRSGAYPQGKGLRLHRLPGHLLVVNDGAGTQGQQRSKQPSYEKTELQGR